MSSIPTKQLDGDVAIGRNVTAGGNADIQGNARVGHNLTVEGWLEAKNIRSCNKGIFPDVATLNKVYPEPHDGWFAGVIATDADLTAMGVTASAGKGYVRLYVGSGGKWISNPARLYEITVDVNQLNSFEDRASALEDAIATAQSTANAAKTAAANAQTAANTAQGTADGAKNKVAEIVGKLRDAGHLIQFVKKGSPDPERLLFTMTSKDLYLDDEHIYTDYVLAEGATADHAGAMTAQHVKDLAALKNDAFEVILFDHIEQDNIAANTSKAPLSASADGCKVVYCRERERFLFGVPAEADSAELTYYNDWEGSERYGTVDSQGVKPAEGKLFIDIAEDNGNLLDIYIFREGALRQTGRSLYDYINGTSQALSVLSGKIGKADGLAPLDASALVPEKHLPDKVFDVLTFGGIDDSLYDLEAGSAAATPEDANASLVYSSVRDRFVLRVRETVSGGGISTNPPKYYGWFNGAERYGTADQDGIVPYENKLYLNLNEGGVYYWYDLMLWKTDLDVSIRVDSLENKIGEANGIAPLNADGVVPNENISDEARKSLFCDLFNAAAGSAGYAKFTNGVWDCKLNGLTLSYNEAVIIYNVTNGAPAVSGFAGTNIRTNLWGTWQYCAGPATDICPPLLFHRCPLLEVISFFNQFCWVTEFRNMFDKCPELTKVIGIIGDGQSGAGSGIVELFPHSPLITSFKLHRLQHNFSFANNPLIDLASFDYMVTNRVSTNTNNYTITVHPDVYAKLTGDTTNEAAAALTSEELAQWQALLTKAAGKHIAFASA